MKESSNLPSVDTRILPKILASRMWGLAEDVEPSRLNIVCWIKTCTAFRMSVKMTDAELMLLKEKFSALTLLGVLQL